jgi:hypothetical protein
MVKINNCNVIIHEPIKCWLIENNKVVIPTVDTTIELTLKQKPTKKMVTELLSKSEVESENIWKERFEKLVIHISDVNYKTKWEFNLDSELSPDEYQKQLIKMLDEE